MDKVKAALNDSVVDGIFEELDMEQMEILKGAGDVNAKTSPGCIAEGIAMGIWVSGESTLLIGRGGKSNEKKHKIKNRSYIEAIQRIYSIK
ncbi:mersacidin family lantibiotic [Listeria monocytogenes]|uniref:mersacidin family lantibiotic n=1 Tax=Listeria monocytogenes TaxID=1639 RepID=UPI00190F19FD|nr:hypothetical protein [Listeria monocytogenes]